MNEIYEVRKSTYNGVMKHETGWKTGAPYSTGLWNDSILFVTASRPAMGPIQPPIEPVPGAISTEIKRPRLEADLPPPSSAEVKNMWSYTCTHACLYGLMLS